MAVILQESSTNTNTGRELKTSIIELLNVIGHSAEVDVLSLAQENHSNDYNRSHSNDDITLVSWKKIPET